jgi:hypothetical protein
MLQGCTTFRTKHSEFFEHTLKRLLSMTTFSLSSYTLNHFDATNEFSVMELPVTSAPNNWVVTTFVKATYSLFPLITEVILLFH